MLIQFYAGLKEYFPATLETEESFVSVEELKNFLEKQNPAAEKLLKISRYACGSEFLDADTLLTNVNIIAVLPPSSGG